MDPVQAAQLMQQGNAAQAPAAPSPQQMLMIQNLMKNPGGLGAMQQPPNSMMQPPPGPPGMTGPQAAAAQPQPSPQLSALGQNAQQLLSQYNQPQPQPNIPVGP